MHSLLLLILGVGKNRRNRFSAWAESQESILESILCHQLFCLYRPLSDSLVVVSLRAESVLHHQICFPSPHTHSTTWVHYWQPVLRIWIWKYHLDTFFKHCTFLRRWPKWYEMVELIKNWIIFPYFLRNWIRFPDYRFRIREILMLSFEITAVRIWRKYQITFSTSQVPRSKVAYVRPIISQCL